MLKKLIESIVIESKEEDLMSSDLPKIDKALLDRIIDGPADAIEVIDFMNNKYPFSENEWEIFVSGRYSKIIKNRDAATKKKIRDAAIRMLVKSYGKK